jgi:RNA methyltransferase, TrmH family
MATTKTKQSTRSAAGERLRRIEGRHNALVKELRQAFVRGERTSDGCVAIEGVRILDEAIRSGLRFRAVFFSASASGKVDHVLPQIGDNVETLLLPDKLFASAVPTESPQGVAALVRWKESSLEDVLAEAASGPLVVLAGLQDPGNLGTIFRSAEAFGAAALLLGEGTVSPLNAKVVRAAAGSAFRLPFVRVKISGLLEQLKSRGIRILATSSHKGNPVGEANLALPVAILFGNEGAGLPRHIVSGVEGMIVVPHSEKVESLNAGVAASIVLYEAAQQNRLRTAVS